MLQVSAIFLLLLTSFTALSQPINREAVIRRHTVNINKFDSLASLSLGNGRFAFTADITGLQSFPEAYVKGVPLGTQSEWGWHSFVDTAGYRFEETLKKYTFNLITLLNVTVVTFRRRVVFWLLCRSFFLITDICFTDSSPHH